MDKEIIVFETEDFREGCLRIGFNAFSILVGLNLIKVLVEYFKYGETSDGFIGTIMVSSILIMVYSLTFIIRGVKRINRGFKFFYSSQELLTIKEEGIIDHRIFGFIPWEEVLRVYTFSEGNAKRGYILAVGINLKNIEEKIEKLPWRIRKSIIKANQHREPTLKFYDRRCTLSPQQICDIIKEKLDLYRNKKEDK